MDTYQRNVQQYQVEGAALSQTLNQLAVLRSVAFVGTIVLIVVLANERLFVELVMTILLGGLGLGLLIKRFNRVAYRKRHTALLQEINEQEVARQKNQLAGFPTGQSFINRHHPYAADLDIFGPHSLFQLLNRTTTESGSILLAQWLLEPADRETILARQRAIQELTPRLAWRQQFQASGMHFRNTKSDYQKLLAWLEQPGRLLPNQSVYLIASILLAVSSTVGVVYYFRHISSPDHVLYIIPLLTVPFINLNLLRKVKSLTVSILLAVLSTVGAVYYFSHISSSDHVFYAIPLLIVLFINLNLLRKVKPIADEIIDSTHQNMKILGGYEVMIKTLMSEEFKSEILQKIQITFSQPHYSASSEIKKLRKILEIFQMRGTKQAVIESNKFYPVFNALWLLDIYWIILTERWKQKNGTRIGKWAMAISECEVLCSLAGFSYANPSFSFPEVLSERYTVRFEALGHPLIGSNRVSNHFAQKDRGRVMMITGSNMAGKSTFLRTVGVNLVLAFAGAPCCAASGQVSQVQLFTSMRTQDDLEAGISSFYAELKRVEDLLSLIRQGQPVFFLLDEMFKGTNSQDRHKGGFSLIKQLSELNAFGIVSTHDLALAELAEKRGVVTNASFNSRIQADEMLFDYTLTSGLCQDFNASELMKKSGIKVLSDIQEI